MGIKETLGGLFRPSVPELAMTQVNFALGVLEQSPQVREGVGKTKKIKLMFGNLNST